MNITHENIGALNAQIAAVCPIDGVSSSGRIDFRPQATPEQRAAAEAVLANFLAAPEPTPLTPTEQAEADCLAALNGGSTRVDLRKLIKAKFISDLAFRLGKAPGALTNAELTAERNRIAAIYKAL